MIEISNYMSVQFCFNIIVPNKNVATTFSLEIDDVISNFPYLALKS